MNMPFELHVALRYLLAKRKQAFISVISLISTLGVTVGVMALVIALALMTGLQTELRDRILGANPHVFVWKPGGFPDAAAETARLKAVPHVTGAAPAIIGKALLSAAGDQAFINVKGIDPVHEPSVTDISGAMRSGSLESLSDYDPDKKPRNPAWNRFGGATRRGRRRHRLGNNRRTDGADADGCGSTPRGQASRRRHLQSGRLRNRFRNRLCLDEHGQEPVR